MANIQKDIATFKREYRKTKQIKTSALAAGYSLNTATQGLHSLPKVITKFVVNERKRLDKYAALADSVDAGQQEKIMRGRIFANIARGEDKACNSIRLGMQDKRVSMLQADTQVGIIVVQPPPGIVEEISRRMLANPAPKLDAILDTPTTEPL